MEARGGSSADEPPLGDDQAQVDAWVRQAQQGDPDAMERLLTAFQDRVWRRALYRLGDREEAGEVAQDAFVLCFRKIGQYRGDAPFWSWLARIVDNQVHNRRAWLKRRGRDVTFSLEAMGPAGAGDQPRGWDPPDDAPDPRREAAARQELEILEACLGRLGEEHREILLLRFADELSYEEIAAALEISLGTVKSRVSRARAELRNLMKDPL